MLISCLSNYTYFFNDDNLLLKLSLSSTKILDLDDDLLALVLVVSRLGELTGEANDKPSKLYPKIYIVFSL